ncbi:unnamed protein product [Rhizopus stolonifer]
MTKDAKPSNLPKLSVSSLASGTFYNCEKHYYLLSKPPNPVRSLEQSLKTLQLERGLTFEDRLFGLHKSIMVDHTHSTDFKRVLQEAKCGTYIYQLRFTLPPEFYQQEIPDCPYRIRSFIPDFLYIHQPNDDGKKKILIIDAKSSKAMSDTHQFQVSSYAYFLNYLLGDTDLEVDRQGGVWLPSDLKRPTLFRIDFMINKIRLFYQQELVRIFHKDPAWRLVKKCTTCPFLAQCKEDAEQMRDIEDLMSNLHISHQTHVGRYVQSYQDQQPTFLGRASVLDSQEKDYVIYISLSVDTYSQKPFAFSLARVQEGQFGRIDFGYVHASYKELEQEVCTAYVPFVKSFVSRLASLLREMDKKQSRCLFYVYSHREKDAIYRLLYQLVSSEGQYLSLLGIEKNGIVEDAMKCLVALFQDTQLLGLPGTIIFPEMESIQRTSSVGRFVSIEDLLEENIALPTPGYYELPEAARWMSKNYKENNALEEKDIHICWLKGNYNDVCFKTRETKTIEKTCQERLFCLYEIMETYWQLADEYTKTHGLELFPLTCSPFRLPVLTSFKHPILAKLVFFKQLESMTSCDRYRRDRISDLAIMDGNSAENNFSISLQFISETRLSQFEVSIRFRMTGPDERMNRLVCNEFQQYIIVPNTRQGIIESIKFSDVPFMTSSKFQKKPIPCVNISEIDVKNRLLTITKLGTLGRPVHSYRLYVRYTDFTMPKVVDAIKMIDQGSQDKDIMKLIKDPNTWANENVMDNIQFNTSSTARKLLEAFNMSFSQKEIVESIFQKRLQIVWGPPGSGKTEFLSLFINWYIQCFVSCNGPKDLLIGITAFTNDAIINLLKRIEVIQRRHGLESLFSIIFGTYRTIEPEGSDILHVKWQESITAINKLKKHQGIRIFVMGTTIYSWNNIKNKWKSFKGCDMMIIDESSQLLVPDALLAIQCLSRPHGKLIIAGDHMQLGPILKNDYSKVTNQDPLLFGSIQQCLIRTEKNQVISTRSFLLEKDGQDFGPNTLQLKDNWRMNQELNQFFQQVYGPDFISRFPQIKLELDQNQLDDRLKSILDPSFAFSLVNVKVGQDLIPNILEEEANIVFEIVSGYLRASKGSSVMVVAPYVNQCVTLKRRLEGFSEQIPVGTIDRMQGQESDLVIACYTCSFEGYRGNFLMDFRRWNVTLSRAR